MPTERGTILHNDTGRSVADVLRRRAGVSIATFGILTVLAGAGAELVPFKFVALSHVVLVNDPTGRDPTVISVDMPTIATGSTVLERVRGELGLAQSVNDLRKSVTARIAPRSTLMTIAVQDTNPNAAVSLDNGVTDAFAQVYARLAGSRYDDVKRRLGADLQSARERLLTLDRRLENASAGSSYVGSQASLDAGAVHLGELEQSRGSVLGELVTDEADLHSDLTTSAKIAKSYRYEILRNNAAYRETESLVGKDLAAYTTTRAGVTDIYPGIAGFRDRIAKERRALESLRASVLNGPDAYSPAEAGQIRQAAKDAAAVAGDQAKLTSLDLQISTLRNALKHPKGTASLGALRAERDAAEAQVQSLTLALTNAEANSAQTSSLGEVFVVDRPTAAHPTLVSRTALFGIGVAAALALAIAAAYLAEVFAPRLLGSGDVERVYGQPILTTLRAR